MAKTYYTKCGKRFEKSSTAVVTRYEELDDKCNGCQYIEHNSTYRGGKEVPITFCQAGSKKPNRKNDYSTTCETDSTTLSIISLDMDFLKSVYEYACTQPGFSRSAEWPKVFHGLDKEDCRKSMPLYFENNKKGKAVKKSIIQKFFKELQQEKLDSCNKCFECDGYQEEGESAEYGKCTKRKSFVTKEQKACEKFSKKPFCTHSNCQFHACMSDDCQLNEVYNNNPDMVLQYGNGVLEYCPYVTRKLFIQKILNENSESQQDNNRCPYYMSHKEDEAFIQCKDTVNVHHADWIRPRDNGELHNRYYHYTCCGSYWACALYQEQAGKKKKTCNTCVNRGFIESARGERVNCPVTGEEVEGNNPDTVCGWHNRQYKKHEDVSIHPEWPNQFCIDCESCIDNQCSQGVFKNTSLIKISKEVKACPRFKAKELPECPYYGGTSPDGRKFKIKCGDNFYLIVEDEVKLQEHVEYCKSGYKSCRAYTRCELTRLGIDLGPASPQKTEHLIDLLQIALSKAASCPNCKNLGVYDYDGYNAEEGTFVWSCKLNLMEAGSNCMCKNYERSPLIEVCDSEKEGMEVYFNGSECREDCHNKRDGKCTITSVSGSAMKFFALDEKAPACENMTNLKVRYLKELKNCSHAHTGCAAAINACSLKGEYCCYTCKHPCNLRCSYAIELVPYGKLCADDKGISDVVVREPAYIYSMEMDTADEQETALNSHLQYIRNKSEDIVGNYVEIGFTLLNIRDNKLFKARGYDSLVDCVESELNMKKSTAYNLIKIAEKFGDPETKRLKAEFRKYNYVQCLEMSTMTKEELSQVNPDMSKREMKQLKDSNRLEKDNEDKEPTTQEDTQGKGLAQIIEGDKNSVIDVTEYKTVDSSDVQEPVEKLHPEEDTAAHGQDETSLSVHRNETVDSQDADPEKNLQHEIGTDQKPIIEEQPEPGAADKNDIIINKLILENDEYKQRVDALQHDKDTLRELVSEIDNKFDKLSKKQIRNALWDFITTGMIIFEDE